MLLNYEEFITDFGGGENSLGRSLHFPIFIGGFTDRGKADLLRMSKTLPADLRTFLMKYDSRLDDRVSKDPRYCMRLTIILESGNRKGDLSLQFVNQRDLTESEKTVVEEIAASKGYVITKNKVVGVSNLDNLKPRQVAVAVQAEIPFVFTPIRWPMFGTETDGGHRRAQMIQGIQEQTSVFTTNHTMITLTHPRR